MSSSEVFELLRRGWLIALAFAIGGGLLSYGITSLQTPVYRATATLVVVRSADPSPLSAEELRASQRLTRTYASLAMSHSVLSAALEAIPDLELSTADLFSRVDISPVFGTQLIEVAAEADNGPDAARIADAVAEAIPGYTLQILKASDSEGGLIIPVVAVPASVPDHPVRPNAQLNTGLGVVAGLIVGSFLAFVRFWYDDTIKSPAELARLDVGILGIVPHVNNPPRRGGDGASWPLVLHPTADPELERSLLVVQDSLRYALPGTRGNVVIVSSPGREEGKTFIAANLSLVLADAGLRVILLDGNLRQPRLHRALGLQNRGGLSAALLGGRPVPVTLPEASRRLRVVTAGARPPSPTQAIRSEQVAELIGDLKGRADFVLIDTGPVLGAPDTSLWMKYADCAILAVRAKRTSLERLDAALSAIEATQRPVAGVVLDDARGGTAPGDLGFTR